MSCRGQALAFIDRFCAGDVDGLVPLLAPDLEFRGPWLACDSAPEYLESLRHDPPQPGCAYDVLAVTEAEDTLTLSWVYRKPCGTVMLTQRFRFRDGRISAIALEFGAAGR